MGRPTLIYGAGRGGHMLLSGLLSNPSVNLRPVAFLDDDPDLSGREVEGYPVYEPLNGVRLLLCNQDVSDVVVSSEKVSDRRIRELSEVCRRVGSEVQVWRFVWRPSRDGELQRVRAGLGGAEPGVKENWEDASGWSPP